MRDTLKEIVLLLYGQEESNVWRVIHQKMESCFKMLLLEVACWLMYAIGVSFLLGGWGLYLNELVGSSYMGFIYASGSGFLFFLILKWVKRAYRKRRAWK